MVITNAINLGQLWHKPYNGCGGKVKVYRKVKKKINDKGLTKLLKLKLKQTVKKNINESYYII